MDWRTGFLTQARSDFAAMQRLQQLGLPECHGLHYLQMVTEKLAKHFGSRPGVPPPRVHAGFVAFLRLHLPQDKFLYRPLGFADRHAIESKVRSLHSVAEKLERLAPALAGPGNPNAEYPWQEVSTGRVVVPSEHTFFAPDEQARLQALVALVHGLLRVLR